MEINVKLIEENVDNVLRATDLKGIGEKKVGKVRDIYIQPDTLILVSTDRHSSFDRIIAHVPFKGQVLTQTSAFWFEQTKDIIKNHVIDTPDPNVVVAQKCSVIPVEMVVRGYITGVTSTSLWTAYSKGQRDFESFTLPEGMKKNQKLDRAVITPTSKSDEHDENLTPKQIVEKGLMTQELWNKVSGVALALFARGQEVALKQGLILVDTKYEFGLNEKGDLTLIDEIHTPDSSRYWFADSYESRFAQGLDPEYFDKEFLRLWFKDHCDPYKDAVLPEAPKELIVEMSRRYIDICQRLTGKDFEYNVDKGPIEARIADNLKKYVIA